VKCLICDNCGWQNNVPNEKGSDLCVSNRMSLKQAKLVYKNGEKTN
jgi:hypothetical protein